MKIKLSIFAMLSIAILLISTLSILSVAHATIYTNNSPSVWFENQPFTFNTANVSIGYLFNVTVAMNVSDYVIGSYFPNGTLVTSTNTGPVPIFSWEISYSFPEEGIYGDSALMNATGFLQAVYGGFSGTGNQSQLFQGRSLVFSDIAVDPSSTGPGSISAGEVLSGGSVPGTLSGWDMFWVEFNVTAAPPKGGSLSGTFSLSIQNAADNVYVEDNESPTPYTIEDSNVAVGYTPMIVYDDPISYTWKAPGAPYPSMDIVCTGTTYPTMTGPQAWPLTLGPYAPTANGTEIMTSIYVQNINSAWYLAEVNFTLVWNVTVIDVKAYSANETIASNWGIVNDNDFSTPGHLVFSANYTGTYPYTSPILVATLNFTVLLQQKIPPAPSGTQDLSWLNFTNVALLDHSFNIYTYIGPSLVPPQGNGEVIVLALVALALPYLSVVVEPPVIGPTPSIGSMVYVEVNVNNLTQHWQCVAVQFRLQYDPTVLALMNVFEGPFLQNPTWDLYGTFYTSMPFALDPIYSVPDVLYGDFLFPNGSGVYTQSTFPNAPVTVPAETPGVNATVAIFEFEVLAQNCYGGSNITRNLNILPFWPPTDNDFVDMNGNYIADFPAHNGTLTIMPIASQPQTIDLFGGAVNDGYGNLVPWIPPYTPYYNEFGTAPYLAFPAPYGGEGPNAPMDIVFPQSWVYLYAYVTYNYFPVEYKDVGFEIEGPFYHVTIADNGGLLYNATGFLVINVTGTSGIYVPEQGQTYYNGSGAPFAVLTLPNSYQVWAKFSATTDQNGVASYEYRMPWPDNPDLYTGVWKVTATSSVADVEINDTMMFYYQRVVYITKVTTDYSSYYHNGYVQVTVDYETHSIEMYPALFSVVITDNLGVPIGMALYKTCVGGTVFCTWLTGSFTVSIYIPKWAYAGNALVHVSVFDKDPTIGGQPWQSEYMPDPVINIYPYTNPLSVSTDQDINSPITWSISTEAALTPPVTYQEITATAVGGFPYLVGYTILYNYTWQVVAGNGTVYGPVQINNLVTTSTYNFYPANWGPGSWFVKVTATDSLGQTAVDEVIFWVVA